MRKLVAAVAAAAALLAVSGCATTDAPPGLYNVGGAYKVTLGHEWSDISGLYGVKLPGVKVLTVDGPLLDRLYLSEGLAPGASLVTSQVKDKPTPIFKSDFTLEDTVQFVADSVAALGYDHVSTANLRPAKFGDADAVRFDLAAKTSDGLDISGAGLTALKGGKLYVILFLAPSEHYYGAGLDEVNGVMASVAFGGA